MLHQFSWSEIFTIAGWPFFIVALCDTLLVFVILERLWYLWKPLPMHLRQQKKRHCVETQIKQEEWEHVFFQEKRRVHLGLIFIRNIIFICPLIGLFGSLISTVYLVEEHGIWLFSEPYMYTFLMIKVGLPFITGLAAFLIALMSFFFYLKGIKVFISKYTAYFTVYCPI